jgi:hypothetical protein
MHTARTALALTAAAGLALTACSLPPDSSDTSSTSTAAAPHSSAAHSSAAAKPKPPAKPKPATIEGDGTRTVPADVKPGTYITRVPTDSFGCYWARLRNTSGDMNAIIANGNVTAGGVVTVTIARSDRGFETQGCGTWTHR